MQYSISGDDLGREGLSMDIDVIYNEDCLIGMDRIPDKSVDMILCDLPYGTTHNKWDSVIPLDRLWEQYRRVIKEKGVVVPTGQIPFTIDLANRNREWLRYEWIWEKSYPTGFLNANRMPMKCHENVLVFYETLGTYNPQGTTIGRKQPTGSHSGNYGDYKVRYNGNSDESECNNPYVDYVGTKNYPRDVITFSKEKTDHPTQKPVSLFEYLIRTYTNEGETVLDNCMGSGTTAVACIRSGRHFIGFETNEEYCKLAQTRINSTVKTVQKKSLEDWF